MMMIVGLIVLALVVVGLIAVALINAALGRAIILENGDEAEIDGLRHTPAQLRHARSKGAQAAADGMPAECCPFRGAWDEPLRREWLFGHAVAMQKKRLRRGLPEPAICDGEALETDHAT